MAKRKVEWCQPMGFPRGHLEVRCGGLTIMYDEDALVTILEEIPSEVLADWGYTRFDTKGDE